MFGHLMPAEINQIKRDYSDVLKSPEATTVTLKWLSLAATASQEVDPIYGTPLGDINPQEQSLGVRVLQHILKPNDLKTYPFAHAEVGWCVFFFPSSLNLDEPKEDLPAVNNTLYIVDPDGSKWEPHLHEEGPKSHHLIFRLGEEQVGQYVLCHPKK